MPEAPSDSEWLESWIRDWSDRLTRFAYALSGSPDVAQGLAQETFYRLWLFHRRHPAQWISPGWLFTVTRNLHRNRVRNETDARPMDAAAGDDTTPQDVASDVAASLDVLAVLDELPEGDRTCLWLFYYADLPVNEVAAALKISETAVKTRLHRARHRFQRLWGGQHPNG